MKETKMKTIVYQLTINFHNPAFQLCIKNLIFQLHLCCTLTALITGGIIFQVVYFYRSCFLICFIENYNLTKMSCMLMLTPGETEEEFSTRLANNLDELIQKEGPDTVCFNIDIYIEEIFLIYFVRDLICFFLSRLQRLLLNLSWVQEV